MGCGRQLDAVRSARKRGQARAVAVDQLGALVTSSESLSGVVLQVFDVDDVPCGDYGAGAIEVRGSVGVLKASTLGTTIP